MKTMEETVADKEDKPVCSRTSSDRPVAKDYFEDLVQPNKERTETEESLRASKLDDEQVKRTHLSSDNRPAQMELSSHVFAEEVSTELPKENVVKSKPDAPDKSDNVDLKNMWQKINLMDQKNQKRQEGRHKNSDCGKQQHVETKKQLSGDTSNSYLSAWECEEENEFESHFREWEKQFETWKKQNKDHPDREGFECYEKQWSEWRERLLRRRDQLRRLRIQRHLIQRE